MNDNIKTQNLQKQIVVFKQGRRGDTICEKKTKESIISFLKENGLDCKKIYWIIDISSVNGLYSDTKKFRVYFRMGRLNKTFIQSDDNGLIDLDKLTSKAKKSIDFYNEKDKNDRLNEEKDKNDKIKMEEINIKLSNTPFKVEKRYSQFVLIAEKYKLEDLEEIIKKTF